jgi:hypothetical protein
MIMKTVALVVAALAVAATPVLAASSKKPNWPAVPCRGASVGDQECSSAQRYDRANVYAYDGRLIGRDPDANVRMQLRDEDAWLRSR